MWLGPVLYLSVSVFLWWYAGAVFMPFLLTRAVVQAVPLLEDLQLVVIINAGLIYFGGYLVFAMSWQWLKPYLRNAFIAGLVLWLADFLGVYSLLGGGGLGLMLAPGWVLGRFSVVVLALGFWGGLQVPGTTRRDS